MHQTARELSVVQRVDVQITTHQDASTKYFFVHIPFDCIPEKRDIIEARSFRLSKKHGSCCKAPLLKQRDRIYCSSALVGGGGKILE